MKDKKKKKRKKKGGKVQNKPRSKNEEAEKRGSGPDLCLERLPRQEVPAGHHKPPRAVPYWHGYRIVGRLQRRDSLRPIPFLQAPSPI